MDLSPSTLFAAFGVSTIGMGFFLYGKKQTRIPALAAGLALMAAPYVIPGATGMLLTAGLVLAGLWLACRLGM